MCLWWGVVWWGVNIVCVSGGVGWGGGPEGGGIWMSVWVCEEK